MKLCYNVERLEEIIEKAFGHKDLSKLTKKQITDKNGHRRNVYVKNGEEPKQNISGKTYIEDIKKRKRVAQIKAMTQRGDTILFEKDKQLKDGMVVAKGDDGVTARKEAFAYQVPYEDIKKNLTKEGSVSPEKFNASEYRNKWQDSKIAELEKANKGDGVKYFLEKYLPGEEGKEMSRKADETEEKVNQQIETEGQTIDNYRISGEGVDAVYSEERNALHEIIKNYYFSADKMSKAMPKPGQKPMLVMLGGRAGAGKSWFTNKEEGGLYNPDEFIVLDADAIKGGIKDDKGNWLCPPIPEYEGWNAGTVHEESSDLNKKLIDYAMKAGLNVIIDGTMNSPEKAVKQIQDFKNAGYFTSCDYMFTPMQESMKRACSRFRTRKNDYSGRFVPLGIMTKMMQNEDAFEAVKNMVDRYSFRDNFNQTNGMATLICQKGDY